VAECLVMLEQLAPRTPSRGADAPPTGTTTRYIIKRRPRRAGAAK
jgi:hypothetical protein